MSDAARQKSEALEPLGAAELVLEAMPLGGIHAESGHPFRFSGMIADHMTAGFQPLNAAFRVECTVLDFVNPAALQSVADHVEHALAIIRMHAFEKTVERSLEAVGLTAVNALEVVGPAHFTALNVPIPVAYVGGIQADLQPVFALSQFCFRKSRRL